MPGQEKKSMAVIWEDFDLSVLLSVASPERTRTKPDGPAWQRHDRDPQPPREAGKIPFVKPITSLLVTPGQTKSGTEHPRPREVVRKFSRLEPDITRVAPDSASDAVGTPRAACENETGRWFPERASRLLSSSDVTEIPEHLLKRSRERRAAMGKGDGDAAEPATSNDAPATTPATTAPAAAPAATGPAPRAEAPAAAAPAAPKPDPAYVTAAKQRRKVPWWAMATLSLMPVWGFMYVRALVEPPESTEGPLGLGAEIYSNCASCHGGDGGGGVGYAFSGGEVLESYPRIQDQIRYVYYGTEGYNLAGIDIPGNPDREGGPHVTGELGVMPAFGGQLTQYQILSVVCHERYTLGGADPTSEEYAEEYELWCSPESPIFIELEEGVIGITDDEPHMFPGPDGEVEIDMIGSVPIPGSSS